MKNGFYNMEWENPSSITTDELSYNSVPKKGVTPVVVITHKGNDFIYDVNTRKIRDVKSYICLKGYYLNFANKEDKDNGAIISISNEEVAYSVSNSKSSYQTMIPHSVAKQMLNMWKVLTLDNPFESNIMDDHSDILFKFIYYTVQSIGKGINKNKLKALYDLISLRLGLLPKIPFDSEFINTYSTLHESIRKHYKILSEIVDIPSSNQIYLSSLDTGMYLSKLMYDMFNTHTDNELYCIGVIFLDILQSITIPHNNGVE